MRLVTRGRREPRPEASRQIIDRGCACRDVTKVEPTIGPGDLEDAVVVGDIFWCRLQEVCREFQSGRNQGVGGQYR